MILTYVASPKKRTDIARKITSEKSEYVYFMTIYRIIETSKNNRAIG